MKYVEINGLGPVLFESSKRAKRLIVTVHPNNGIRVAIPRGVSFAQGENFVCEKIEWIEKQMARMERAEQKYGKALSEIDMPAARRKLEKRISDLAAKHGFTYDRVTIRNQKTRWGSCSAKDNISLNYKLAMLPDELCDYVILHELVHTRVRNHSREFWDELGKYVEDPKKRAAELRKYGLVIV